MTIMNAAAYRQWRANSKDRVGKSRECSHCGALRLYGHGCTHCGAMAMTMLEFGDAIRISAATPEWKAAVKKWQADEAKRLKMYGVASKEERPQMIKSMCKVFGPLTLVGMPSWLAAALIAA